MVHPFFTIFPKKGSQITWALQVFPGVVFLYLFFLLLLPLRNAIFCSRSFPLRNARFCSWSFIQRLLSLACCLRLRRLRLLPHKIHFATLTFALPTPFAPTALPVAPPKKYTSLRSRLLGARDRSQVGVRVA